MARMTEEEANRLDELWTPPEIDTSKPGYFTQHMAHLIEVAMFRWLTCAYAPMQVIKPQHK